VLAYLEYLSKKTMILSKFKW